MSENIKFWSEMNLLTTVNEDDKLMIGNKDDGEACYAEVGNLPFLKWNDLVQNVIYSNQWNPIIIDVINPSSSTPNQVKAIYADNKWSISYQDITNEYTQPLTVIERKTGIIHVLETNGRDTVIQYLDLSTLYDYNIGSINVDKATSPISVDFIGKAPQNSTQSSIIYDNGSKKWTYQTINDGKLTTTPIRAANDLLVYSKEENKFYHCTADGKHTPLSPTYTECDFKDITFLGAENITSYDLEEFKTWTYRTNNHYALILSELEKLTTGEKVGVPYYINGLPNNVGYSIGTVEKINIDNQTITIKGLGYIIASKGIDEENKNAVITIGEIVTAPEGNNANVENTGSSTEAVLKITIPRGADGQDGEKGEKGDTGEKGNDGQAPNITLGEIKSGTEANVEIIEKEGNVELNFTIPKGTDGQKGEKGTDGQKGEKGQKGLQGEKGKDGQAPDITKGTVITGTEAKVEREESDTGIILYFTLPQGQKGNPGTAGTQGDDGEAGEDAQAPFVKAGSVTAEENAKVEVATTQTGINLNFALPKGAKGAKGLNGDYGPKGYPGDTDTYIPVVRSVDEFIETLAFCGGEYNFIRLQKGFLAYDWYNRNNNQFTKSMSFFYDPTYTSYTGSHSNVDLDEWLHSFNYVDFPYNLNFFRADVNIRPMLDPQEYDNRLLECPIIGYFMDVYFYCPDSHLQFQITFAVYRSEYGIPDKEKVIPIYANKIG